MISEGSCDTEDWSNDAIDLLFAWFVTPHDMFRVIAFAPLWYTMV